ncbi:hypothetical protein KW805_00490 [Candidatus Pacearchaeota archaeon]|nr:hypothetical protein [Candidatus Pacearchaeota archaeon]
MVKGKSGRVSTNQQKIHSVREAYRDDLRARIISGKTKDSFTLDNPIKYITNTNLCVQFYANKVDKKPFMELYYLGLKEDGNGQHEYLIDIQPRGQTIAEERSAEELEIKVITTEKDSSYVPDKNDIHERQGSTKHLFYDPNKVTRRKERAYKEEEDQPTIEDIEKIARNPEAA